MTFQMKTIEEVHGKLMFMYAWHYMVICLCVFGKLTKHVLTVLLGVSGTSGSKGKGSA